MPISRKYRAWELEGRRVTNDRDLETRGGRGALAGWKFTIKNAHRGIEAVSDPCPMCGSSFFIRATREDFTLIDEDKKK